MPNGGIAGGGRKPAAVLKRSPPRAARAAPRKAAPKAARTEPSVSAESTPTLVDKDLRYVNLYYGTNRARTASCSETNTTTWNTPSVCRASSFYAGVPSELSDDQASELEVGTLTVTFPPDHESGEIERPVQIFSVALRDENPEKDVVISEIRSFGGDHEAWAEEMRRTGRKQAFIYVHGYATTFDQAARRAAQLAYDLDFDLQEDFRGLPMFYSWPSRGETGAYAADYDVSIDAVKAFNRFLDLVKVEAGVERVHIIAHSMGNRLVANALAGRLGPPSHPVDQLVLAAPDIWSREFRRSFLKKLPQLVTRVTLYVSDRDRALIAASKIRKGEPRAGQVEGGLLKEGGSVKGFDAVDASDLSSDFLGHSYYASNPMLSDIYCLLKGIPPEGRPLILKAGTAWTFKQGEDLKKLALAGAACEVPALVVFPTQWGTWWIAAPAIFVIAAVIWLMRRRRSAGSGS